MNISKAFSSSFPDGKYYPFFKVIDTFKLVANVLTLFPAPMLHDTAFSPTPSFAISTIIQNQSP